MKTNQVAQKGFTLIELMIVIAIVGILAAIALPAYQDYIVRSKMSEPLAALAEAKTSIAEFYATKNRMPLDTNSGINISPDKDIVKSIVYDCASTGADDCGVITATLQDDIIPGGTGTVYGFSLSPLTSSDGTIQWVCGGTEMGGSGATRVTDKYLPSSCRGV
jgi:type IV pilus assembly protein PilA